MSTSEISAESSGAAPGVEAAEPGHGSGDHFIPVRKLDIVEALAARGALPGGAGAANFRQFCLLVSHMMHYQYFTTLEALRDAYFYLNPDMPAEKRPPSIDLDGAYRVLTEHFEEVMTAANFQEVPSDLALTPDEEGRLSGVTVKTDLSAFREVKLYRRGRRMEELVERRWLGLKKRRFQAEVYDHVVLFAAVKPDPRETQKRRRRAAESDRLPPGSVIIKYFRDIVRADLRMLYPNARVVMSLKDTMMLGVPALFGLVPLSIKLLPAFTVMFLVVGSYLGVAGTVEGDRLKQAMAAMSVLMALGAFMLRQWGNYQRRSLLYQKQVADTVYYCNVNNNAGIFDYIIGAAEEQEVKEAVLAYYFLATAERPLNKLELDQRIEAWLRETFEVDIDFEVQDALAKLERMEILNADPVTGALSVQRIDDALVLLDRQWDNFFQFNR